MVKFVEWARRQRISYKAAWRCEGRYYARPLAADAWRNDSGCLLIDEKPATVALHPRASHHDQLSDLARQVTRLWQYAAERDLHVVESVCGVGSGLNRKGRKLLRLLSDAKVGAIVVEHRDDSLVSDQSIWRHRLRHPGVGSLL